MVYKPTGGQTYLLASSIGSTDTTILLTSFTEPVSGTAYTMANIGSDIVYATIAPKTTSSEFISFTGITQNVDGTATLTGVTRGLSRSTPFTSSATFKLPHSGQSQLILSNSPQQINEYVTLRNAETISGVKTFSAFPVTPSSAPTANYEVANKKYVDDTVLTGAPDATTTVKGAVEIATQAEVDAKTATGGTGASIVPTPALMRATKYNDYVVDTGSADAYVITTNPTISAYSAGQVFVFRATNANTGASTLNVCSVGTQNIVKNHDVALVSGDIEAGQIVAVCTDGTVFQMLGQIGTDPATVYQLLANLDGTTNLGTSVTKYPSQNAVKTYVDTQDSAITTKLGGWEYDGKLTLSAEATKTYTLSKTYDAIKILINLTGSDDATSLNLIFNSVSSGYSYTVHKSTSVANTTGAASLVLVLNFPSAYIGEYIISGKHTGGVKTIAGSAGWIASSTELLMCGSLAGNSADLSTFTLTGAGGSTNKLTGTVKVYGLTF